MPKFQHEPKDKYYPWKDVDKNGVIIITDFTLIEEPDQNNVMLFNISGQYNGKGLGEVDPEKSVTFDFRDRVNGLLRPEDLEFIVKHIDALYNNEINSLCFRDVPGLSYSSIAGFEINLSDSGGVQWERKDLDKIVAHLRMLYDSTLTKQ